jgi:hypothetical protein
VGWVIVREEVVGQVVHEGIMAGEQAADEERKVLALRGKRGRNKNTARQSSAMR